MKRLNCVLVVDDDRVSNYVTENVLRSFGVFSMVNTVSDGQTALEYIKYQCAEDDYACPELILLDINMRVVGGIEFVRRYKSLNLNFQSLIVILSTLPLREDQEKELRELGVYEHIVKPLNTEKLQRIMSEYFSDAVSKA